MFAKHGWLVGSCSLKLWSLGCSVCSFLIVFGVAFWFLLLFSLLWTSCSIFLYPLLWSTHLSFRKEKKNPPSTRILCLSSFESNVKRVSQFSFHSNHNLHEMQMIISRIECIPDIAGLPLSKIQENDTKTCAKYLNITK